MSNGKERKVEQAELVRNMLIVARSNGWLGDIVRKIGESEEGITMSKIVGRHTTVLAAIEGKHNLQEIQILKEKVEKEVEFLTRCGIFLKSEEGLFTISPLARQYWDRFSPGPPIVPTSA